jgi:hypothetical protein
MKFKEYLLTDAKLKPNSTKDELSMMNTVINSIKSYGLFNSPVIWRGFNHRTSSIVYKVTNDRSGSYYGKQAAMNIIKGLGLQTEPIFITRTYNNARFFGTPHIFVPDSNFISYYNKDVQDVMHVDNNSNVDEIISGYVKNMNKIPASGNWNEIILSCKSYYLINQAHMIFHVQKSRYATIKNPGNISTYKDVVKLYNDYVSYFKWFYKQRGKEFGKDD